MKSARILLFLALLLVATLGIAADPVSANVLELRQDESAETKIMEGGILQPLERAIRDVVIGMAGYIVLTIVSAILMAAVSGRLTASPVEVTGASRGTLPGRPPHDI